MNLNVKNHHFQEVTSYIQEISPDAVLIEELTPEWRQYLKDHLKEYPHSIEVPGVDTYGIGVYSKTKLTDGKVEYIGKSGHPSIVAKLSGLEKPVTLLHTHIQGPVKKPFFVWHKEQIELTAPVIQSLAKPLVLSGDMNSNAWTYLISDLLDKTELIDTQRGRGIHLTWPAPFYWRNWPFPLLSIDHFFVSKDIAVLHRKIGKPIHSDHYPVLIELALSSK